METKKLTPYNLSAGENYFLEEEGSNSVKWYITNKSSDGYPEPAGFSINTNYGYNSSKCYVENSANFYGHNNSNAYTNFRKPVFRRLTTDEEIWFRYCKKLGQFIPFDEVIKKQELKEFPSSGVCWNPTLDLLKFISKKTNTRSENVNQAYLENKGLAWNSVGFWAVQRSSSQQEYTIKQLEPFLVPEHVKHYPLTPEECDFPEKWSLNITLENKHLIKDFLVWKQNEYVGYSDGWIPDENCTFFYPQYHANAYCVTGHYHKQKGYTLITTNQFIKHVLTHTDKQQQINEPSKIEKDEYEKSKREGPSGTSCKIQRFNISIRNTAPIRGIGLKCSKIQIKVGSGHLPN